MRIGTNGHDQGEGGSEKRVGEVFEGKNKKVRNNTTMERNLFFTCLVPHDKIILCLLKKR